MPPVKTPEPEKPKPWFLVGKVEGRNPGPEPKGRSKKKGKNEGGLVICVNHTHGHPQEVERVAFNRANSTNPDLDFDERVDQVIEKANRVLELLNGELLGDGSLT